MPLLVSDNDNLFICDFCGFEVSSVKRIVLDHDYNRVLARALYACESCSEQKEKERIGDE